MDQKRFEEAKRKIIGVDRQRLGIGTLSEKTVHAIFKDYYEPDEDHQEIPIENYVADIYRDGEIIEIQTRQFNRMRGKLQTFLPLYPVTIVYPIPYEKWLIWIDEDSGELSKKRKSPKKGCTYQALGCGQKAVRNLQRTVFRAACAAAGRPLGRRCRLHD